MYTAWDFAKDYGSPMATIIASGAALIVTFCFNRRQLDIAAAQKEIAHSQRNIARDKLKYDLFTKRYEIYETARSVIEYVSHQPFDGRQIEPKFILMLGKLDECAFFFPQKEVELFLKIRHLAERHEIARIGASTDKDEKVRYENSAAAGEALKELVKIYNRLLGLLKDELGFAQLTSAS
jgi:hypothetical protein